MRNVQAKGKRGKGSDVGAVAGGTATAPGERALGSPHGSNARLFIAPDFDVVLAEETGSLGLMQLTTVVSGLLSLQEAQEELRNWSEGMDVPTWDPAAGWPF